MMDNRLKTHRLLTLVQALAVSKVEIEEQVEKLEAAVGDLAEMHDAAVDELVSDAIYALDKIQESLKTFDKFAMKAKSLSGEKK